MRINSLQVHPTPMWTSTLRGCQATPVSHCVKLKHNHPRPSPPSYEPGNPPSSLSPLHPPLFSFSALHFPSSATVHRPPLLFSFPLPRRRLPYIPFLTDRSNPLQLSFILLPLSPFLLFLFPLPLFFFLFLLFFFFFFSSSSSSPLRIQFLFLFVHLFGFFFFFFCLLSFFFFLYIYIYFFFLYDFS